MDPLSIAASVAGLLGLAASVVSAGYSLISRMSRNADDLRALTNETAAFSGILLGVKTYLESQAPLLADLQAMEKMLRESGDTLKEIAAVLERLSKANRLALIVTSEGREKRLEKLFRQVEQYKLFFILCFNMEQSSQSEAIQRRAAEIISILESLSDGQSRVEKGVGTLLDSEQVRRRDKIIEWLGLPTAAEHGDLCRQRDSESGRWILDREEFGNWLSSRGSSFFWLNGSQGSGKSVIVSRIIEAIHDTDLGHSGSALAYHYCHFSNPWSLEPSRLVGSFAGQLLKQSPDPGLLMGRLDELYEEHGRRSTLPSINDLQEIFMEMSQYFGRIFLVVDGLDEMADRWSILDFFEGLSAGDGDFKVFVASRAEVDLRDAFSFYCTVTIKPSDIASDVERYVRMRLGKRRFRGPEIEDIVRELTARADGMFLWVVCQLNHLVQLRTTITPRLLQALPRDLERTFEQTFLKLDDGDKALAKRILQFVMFSNTPMDLSELVDGVAVTSNTQSLGDIKHSRLERDREVFEICGSLIRESQSTGKIELAHYSVYTFLRSPRLEGGRTNDFYLDTTAGNLDLLLASVRYLNMEDLCTTGLPVEVEEALKDDDSHISPEMFASTPFLGHAAANLLAYVSRLSQQQLTTTWDSDLLRFFVSSRGQFEFWAMIARYKQGTYKYPHGLTPLHAVALFGLPDLAHLLMRDGSLSAAPWRHPERSTGTRTPLHVAIENGHDEMMNVLMHDSYIDSVDEKGRIPLHIALECGNMTAVTQLISAGADVNRPKEDGRTPIFIAIENSWDQLAPTLARMADPSVAMPDGRTLLHLAAQTGSTAWAAALLESCEGVNIDAMDEAGWTPLLYAVDRGHGGMVEMLLARGACVAISNRDGWTPLHAALRRRDLDCVKALLTSTNPKRPLGAPESEQGGSAGRPGGLTDEERSAVDVKYGRGSAASGSGEGSAAGISAEQPASPSISSSDQLSPLFLAVSINFIAGVELLLEHFESYGHNGIRVSEQDDACLKTAMALPNTTIFELLLPASGASSILAILRDMVVRRDEMVLAVLRRKLESKLIHADVLPLAIPDGSSAEFGVAELVLDLWPPSGDTLPEDILQKVAAGQETPGRLRLMSRLVEGGAARSSKDREGSTPLQTAISRNNWGLAEAFIVRWDMTDAGAVPNVLHTLVEDARLPPTTPPQQRRRQQHQREGDDGAVAAAATNEMHAAEVQFCGALHVANLLVDHGNVDVCGLDEAGRGLCHKAATRADSVLLRWVLDRGAYAALADKRGDTPVHLAAAFGQVANLRLLLERIVQGAPAAELARVLQSSGLRRPPLMLATDAGHVGVLEALVEADALAAGLADADEGAEHVVRLRAARMAIFTDALCNAIRKGFDRGVAILIAALVGGGLGLSGPNLTPAPTGGDDAGGSSETPLHVAVRQEREDYVRMLIDGGARVDARMPKTGQTPLDLAEAAIAAGNAASKTRGAGMVPIRSLLLENRHTERHR